MPTVRLVVRWILSMVLVSLPISYLLWNWNTDGDALFRHLSYDGFRAEYLGDAAASYRTFALWVLLVFMVVNI